MNERFEV